MKGKTSSFNKLVIYSVLTLFISSPFIAVVLATKDYNSSKSNTTAIAILKDEIGLSEDVIDRILGAFDDEVRAYAEYEEAKAVAVTVIQREGLSAVEAKRLVSDTGIQKMSAEDVSTKSISRSARIARTS